MHQHVDEEPPREVAGIEALTASALPALNRIDFQQMDLKPTQDQPFDDPDLELMTPLCAVFRRHLKSLGQKYTPERAQILDALMDMEDPFQVDELQETLKARGRPVSKATVYRTIKLLQEAGILQQVLFDADQAHYQLAFGRAASDLIIRVDTNEVIQIDVPELAEIRDRLCREHGLEPEGHRFQIFAAKPGSTTKDR